MDLDISYLLFLQELRNATGGVLDGILNSISKTAVSVLPLVAYMIYWCVDKKWGNRMIATVWGAKTINEVIKLTVCAYRPWIRDARILPPGDAMAGAAGYSFPSGHTVYATAVCGTVAVWQRCVRRWLTILSVIIMFLIIFSRNWLGVHTPQDVVIGFLETAGFIFLTGKLQEWTDIEPKRADGMAFAGIALVFVMLFYITHKSYPLDYVDGSILVDPEEMKTSCFNACGGAFGFLAGNFLERHSIHYKIPSDSQYLPILACAGLAIVYVWQSYLAGATAGLLFGVQWGSFVSYALTLIFVTAIWPMMIMKGAVNGWKSNAHAQNGSN